MTKFYLDASSQVRERGEVPAGADGPLLRDPGEAGGVEGVDELPQGARGDAGVALGQHVDAQGQQHPECEGLTTTSTKIVCPVCQKVQQQFVDKVLLPLFLPLLPQPVVFYTVWQPVSCDI